MGGQGRVREGGEIETGISPGTGYSRQAEVASKGPEQSEMAENASVVR
jgi:hypothetical protein